MCREITVSTSKLYFKSELVSGAPDASRVIAIALLRSVQGKDKIGLNQTRDEL